MADYLEDHLDMPIRRVLPVIQEGILNRTTYFGIRTLKNPLDAWVYQELIFDIKPDVIVEIGTAHGGSALLLAHLCDNIGHGRVISLDLSHETVPERVKTHPRIRLIETNASDGVEDVARLISTDETVLVIDDSAHTYDNTLNVLRLYSGLIKPGGYFIVEDGICHHGLDEGPQPGPYEAVETFVDERREFEIDRSREHFLITWNPKGYLRRKIGADEVPSTGRAELGQAGGTTWRSVRETVRLFVPPIVVQAIGRLRGRR